MQRFGSMFAEMQDAGIEKCFLLRIGSYNGSGSYDYDDIIEAQTEICKTNPDVVMVTANQYGFRARGLMKDDFHYYQAGYDEMGEFAGINVAQYVTTGKEPTMYDTKYDNLYYAEIN